MHLEKFVHSYTGKIMMSVLLGFGLATFFRFAYKCKKMEKNAIHCDKKKTTVRI